MESHTLRECAFRDHEDVCVCVYTHICVSRRVLYSAAVEAPHIHINMFFPEVGSYDTCELIACVPVYVSNYALRLL